MSGRKPARWSRIEWADLEIGCRDRTFTSKPLHWGNGIAYYRDRRLMRSEILGLKESQHPSDCPAHRPINSKEVKVVRVCWTFFLRVTSCPTASLLRIDNDHVFNSVCGQDLKGERREWANAKIYIIFHMLCTGRNIGRLGSQSLSSCGLRKPS